MLSPVGKASLQRLVLDLVKLTWAAAAVVAMLRWSVSGAATGEMMSRLAATPGHSGGVAADLVASGGLGVAPPCAFAKRGRVLPEGVDDCSSVCRRLSHRERAIIREVNEIAFALNFLETGGVAGSESCKKSGVLHVVN